MDQEQPPVNTGPKLPAPKIKDVIRDFGPKLSPANTAPKFHGVDEDALAAQIASAAGMPAAPSPMSSSELMQLDAPVEYHIPGVLAVNQPCIIGGPRKSLKTSIAVDLAISISTGTPFLGKFNVVAPCPVWVMTGESGPGPIKSLASRVLASRGRTLNECFIDWSFELPKLSMKHHVLAIEKTIALRGVRVLIIDPAYLALGDVGGSATNIFEMGKRLSMLTKLGERTNCTIILLHHTTKDVTGSNGPLDLSDLAFAGFSEWARQWILIGRRSRYVSGSGRHSLWLSAGGSAGHGGEWVAAIDEGTEDEGRKWDVRVMTHEECRSEESKARIDKRDDTKAMRESEAVRRLIDLLTAAAEPVIVNTLRTMSKLNSDRFKPALKVLLDDGLAEEVAVIAGNNRSYKAVRLKQ